MRLIGSRTVCCGFLAAVMLGGCATNPMPEILPVTEMPGPVAAQCQTVPTPQQDTSKDAEIISLRSEVSGLRAELEAVRRVKSEQPQDSVPAPPSEAAPKPAAASTGASTGPKSILPVKPVQTAVPDNGVKPAVDGKFGVHLASYRSPEMAAEGWRTLVKKFPTVLPLFTPQVAALVMGGKDGKYYRLIAGPLASREDAQKLCKKLADGADFCAPTELSGEPLLAPKNPA
ncbi:SPOR domain-containing protein [Govanella unica]|uniref:SPOR domain-containing protein n=1 Tax=Govanella unica TaxID=2975056 RepID=A0A9X3TYF8_9PROT|nr:SPOR domain-containing protein [Govania unica]MDA5194286.1 SPOR domain-containing protein [Govania unica]